MYSKKRDHKAIKELGNGFEEWCFDCTAILVDAQHARAMNYCRKVNKRLWSFDPRTKSV